MTGPSRGKVGRMHTLVEKEGGGERDRGADMIITNISQFLVLENSQDLMQLDSYITYDPRLTPD